MNEYTAKHGLTGAPVQYGLLDNARRARLGATVDDYRRDMAELFAPFSEVAARNPLSSSPVSRSVDELLTVTAENRMICDPYPRLMVARDQVNQGAAVLIMSVAAARRLSVPESAWVYLHGHADMVEQQLLDREDLSASFSAEKASKLHRRISSAPLPWRPARAAATDAESSGLFKSRIPPCRRAARTDPCGRPLPARSPRP